MDNIIKLYECKQSNQKSLKKILIDSGANFPDILYDEFLLSKYIEKALPNKNKQIVSLPFCNTILSEPFNADIKWGDNNSDSFIDNYIVDKVSEFPENIETLTSRKIEVLLKTSSILSSKGYKVSFNIDGPMTILGSLIDPINLFKSFKKEPNDLRSKIIYISNLILDFSNKLLDSGVSVLSYSDSSGTMDLIGPKLFNAFCLEPNIFIIKELNKKISKVKAIIHICGKTTLGLFKSNRIKLLPHKTNYNTYSEAIIEIIDSEQFKIIGNSCLGRLNLKPFNSEIFEVKIV